MNGLAKILDWLAAHPRLAAMLFGLIAACGFPPLHVWPLTLLGVAGLGWLAWRSESARRTFGLGWLFGVVHFTFANNWIATAFTYQSEMPAALGWLAVPLLSLYLAVYPALAVLAAWLIAGRSRKFGAFALAFAGAWVVTEWLRSWVFTGYAWDPLSLALLGPFDRPGIAAALPWFGTYALSGFLVLVSGGIALAIMRRRFVAVATAFAALAIGMYLPAGEREEGTLAFTLIQPDTRQDELNDPTKFEEQFARTAMLSRKQRDVERRLVLWPESGVPDYLEDGYPTRYYVRMTANADPKFARERIGRVIGEDAVVLTGAVDLEIEDDRAVGARNAVTAINSAGEIVGSYDKAHLVPYGEYLALRWLLEPLGASRLVAGTIDFWPGPGPDTIELGEWGKAGVQICYEIVFSGQVVNAANRPDYIFNPSNDGWFGAFGPPQHLAQARMRAIEEGLPVLRSTTTGISAVIDADGVVRSYIGMHKAARIDGYVPPAKPPTLFSRLGNWLAMGWAALLILASLVATRRGAR
ncbi:apolipoprotein N-acyltransferase [Erythrobacter sp. HKB08]|uniref:apolipoprotein N-acyltransferase n=1 Tax=Erythrobacter sp. HKB08 TaxID=2502843 RepID=UPI001008A39A|nr:apolipoprotein N-acyltransferase [Erythrobacter sp. HKB08]